ncbi:MAG: hypothetical protein CMO47_00855 [Verrucomicrobiales bacterium]|nr:hypothetical protein [Verrucomicrobiales bacterium]|tara:strand:+ start:1412 stop:1975 length:564 start_codon:yes stop_codon:yes gene_type:complete
MDWYYASAGQQEGPVSEEDLIELFRSGQVKGSDLVWNKTMTDWVALKSIPELANAGKNDESAELEVEAVTPPAIPSSAAATTAAAASSPAMTPAPDSQARMEKVPTYLWQSILCFLLFFWPFAIPAIVYATRVQPFLQAGDVALAKEASKKAKKWVKLSVIVGVSLFVLICALYGAIAYLATNGQFE